MSKHSTTNKGTTPKNVSNTVVSQPKKSDSKLKKFAQSDFGLIMSWILVLYGVAGGTTFFYQLLTNKADFRFVPDAYFHGSIHDGADVGIFFTGSIYNPGEKPLQVADYKLKIVTDDSSFFGLNYPIPADLKIDETKEKIQIEGLSSFYKTDLRQWTTINAGERKNGTLYFIIKIPQYIYDQLQTKSLSIECIDLDENKYTTKNLKTSLPPDPDFEGLGIPGAPVFIRPRSDSLPDSFYLKRYPGHY